MLVAKIKKRIIIIIINNDLKLQYVEEETLKSCVCVDREQHRDSSLNIRQLCIVCWILCFHSIVAVCYQYVDPLRLSVDVQSLFVRAKHHHILHAQPSHRFLSIRNKHLQSDT